MFWQRAGIECISVVHDTKQGLSIYQFLSKLMHCNLINLRFYKFGFTQPVQVTIAAKIQYISLLEHILQTKCIEKIH